MPALATVAAVVLFAGYTAQRDREWHNRIENQCLQVLGDWDVSAEELGFLQRQLELGLCRSIAEAALANGE